MGKNSAGIITSWNPAAERIFGYTAREAIGQSTKILFPPSQINEELDILARIARGEKVQHFDTLRRRKDGTLVNVSVTVSPIIDGSGNIIGASKIARDISHRKSIEAALRDSEERFRVMANSIPQMAWTARADGSIYWYNQRWYDFTGTTPGQMEGWDWQAVPDPEVLARVVAQWTAAIDTGEPFEMEFAMRGADGQFRQFLNRAIPVKDASGQVLQWVGTNTDVDEIKRVEKTLRAKEALLKQLNANLINSAAENALVTDALYLEKERARVTLTRSLSF